MDKREIENRVKEFKFWYHKIDLGDGIVTPGLDFELVWDMIRRVRSRIAYQGANVLDIASFDGMWAFEAERLGAKKVIAIDSYFEQFKNFLFCREVLGSNVIPFYNVPPHEISNRLDVYLQEDMFDGLSRYERLFDIVHHLGLFYHLRDPLLTLSQSRSVMKTGGHLLIETGAVVDDKGAVMLFNGTPFDNPTGGRIYADMTTWWAPTIPCLKEMLRATMFEPIEESIEVLEYPGAKAVAKQIKTKVKHYLNDPSSHTISRVALVARAIGSNDIGQEYYKELARTYRNPFLVTDFLDRK